MSSQDRFHSLDAVRAFALLLGVALHASMAFVPGMFPGIWSTVDTPSVALGQFFFVTHIFRMALFFVIAGFFARMLYQRAGVRGFWFNRLQRIAVPLLVGWLVLSPIFSAVHSWGVSEYFGGKVPAMPAGMKMPAGYFPFIHLWFLYALLLLYPLTLLLHSAVTRADRSGSFRAKVDRVVSALLDSPVAVLSPVLLGAPLAITLFLREKWIYWGGIPAQDTTWIPQIPMVVGFGFAMIVGWLLHRQTHLLQALARRWALHLAAAVAATVYCSFVAGPKFAFTLHALDADKALFALAYAAAGWSWIFALMGLGVRFFSGESAVRRYMADASYWVYLAHLPLVAALNVVVQPWSVHWSLKFGFVLVAAFAVLFASYHFLVRPTFIGEWLNGRRHPRSKTAASELAAPVAQAAAASAPVAGVVAELKAVTRRYGTQVALDNIDLNLREGELLALLGPNGAGKSSAISLWLGLAAPDAGEATLLGGSPQDVDSRRGIGVMMQDVTLTQGMKVRELIDQAASYYPDPLSVDEVMSITHTTEFAGRVYDKLSGGQKRQVQFALAICGRPKVLFLDEPTVGLDIAAREHLWAAIRHLRTTGVSILLTTHYLEEAESLADRVVVLAKGRVVASGTVDEVRGIVSRRHIRCHSSLAPDALSAWPGVVSVSRVDTERLAILTTDAEAVLRRLLATDQGVKNLEVQQAGLAEAFVELTKEAA
jgi:ABC-type multidrug transport system ATPase subunit/peptidoglycan/LPS O-acetylase OafA/YrhL